MSLIRREDFPLFDESLKRFIDWDLWLTLLESGKRGIHVPEYLFKCLPHPKAISAWLPSFAYKAPWKWLPVVGARVRAYEEARKIIINKHHLS